MIVGALSLFALFALVSLHVWVPYGAWGNLFVPGLDLLAVLVLVRLGAGRKLPSTILALPLAVLALLLAGESFFLHAYRRSFSPRADLQFFLPFVDMMAGRPVAGFAVVAAATAVVAALTTAMYALIRAAGLFLVGLRGRAVRVAATLAVTATLLGIYPGSGIYRAAAMWFNNPPVALIPPAPPSTLPAFTGADVGLFMVESYGTTYLTGEEHRPIALETLARAEDRLAEAGFFAASGILDSPAFGGRSWLADGTVLTGVRLEDQTVYDIVQELGDAALLTAFRKAGYRSVISAPGTTFADEDWKRLYAFDDYLFAGDFGYEGPYVAFGRMPDQYQIYGVHRFLTANGGSAPWFVQYVLATSHVPWDTVPPYFPDWDELGDGSLYRHGENLVYFDNRIWTGREYTEGYTASLEYVLDSVLGYLTGLKDDFALAVILGDHQPKYPVTERGADSGVILHLVSRRRDLIEDFLGYGYVEGLVPAATAEGLRATKGMERLTWEILEVGQGRAGEGEKIAGIFRRKEGLLDSP